tara:strand:- start:1346 stop:1501 length:156 start_codon:yes stop_codon:yes gene_type:complete
MEIGDLATTLIKNKLVILLKQEAKQVWRVIHSDGTISSEWALNLVPYEIII